MGMIAVDKMTTLYTDVIQCCHWSKFYCSLTNANSYRLFPYPNQALALPREWKIRNWIAEVSTLNKQAYVKHTDVNSPFYFQPAEFVKNVSYLNTCLT